MKTRVPIDCQIPDPIERRTLFTLNEVYDHYLYHDSDDYPRTFVEVGGYDGETHSNTCLLADDGWHGIYIEPVPDFAEKCKARHINNDIEVWNVAVSDFEGYVNINVDEEWTAISEQGIQVPCIKLNKVFDNLGYIDLLVIDVEGHELQVLQGSNLIDYAPSMCIIEMHEEPSLSWLGVTETNKLITNYMESAGYVKIWFDYVNTIFMHQTLVDQSGNFFEIKGINKC